MSFGAPLPTGVDGRGSPESEDEIFPPAPHAQGAARVERRLASPASHLTFALCVVVPSLQGAFIGDPSVVLVYSPARFVFRHQFPTVVTERV
jgi:hypothetical protein